MGEFNNRLDETSSICFDDVIQSIFGRGFGMRLYELLGAASDGVHNDGQAGQFVPAKHPNAPKDQNALSINRIKKRARYAVKGKKLKRKKRTRKEEIDMSPTVTSNDMGQTDRMVHDFYNRG